MKKRWYDNHDETLQTFDILKKLDNESKKRLANDIVEVANQIKAIHREEEEPSLTIGLERVLGIWQSTNARRWYDKQQDLNIAIKTISTLPEEDFLNIMEGICVSLKE